VVWLGKMELARAEMGTRCKGPGAEMGAWSERRRDVAEGFAANRAVFGADEVGANPVSPLLTTRIDTLDGGARHQGHNPLPQSLPAHE